MWRTCGIFLKTWEIASTNCIVSARNAPFATYGLFLRPFWLLGPQTRREVCVEEVRPLGIFQDKATVVRFSCHQHRSWEPLLTCSWSIHLFLSCEPCSGSWWCAGQLGACEGWTSLSNENSYRGYRKAFLGEFPGRRKIPAVSFPGVGADKLGTLAAFVLLLPGGPALGKLLFLVQEGLTI